MRATQGFNGSCAVVVTGAYGEQNLADVDAGYGAVGLAPCAAHAGLQSIGAGAGQHFVDADDVEGVGADAEMKTFFAGDFDEVPVGSGRVFVRWVDVALVAGLQMRMLVCRIWDIREAG